MNKKKIFLIIIIPILIILMLIIVHITRNYMIINEIEQNASKYSNKNNFHIVTINNDSNNGVSKVENYVKNNKKAVFVYGGNNEKISWYNNGQQINLYTETPNGKNAILDCGTNGFEIKVESPFKYIELWKAILFAQIKNTEHNGKKAYEIEVYGYSLGKFYVDKETGLTVKRLIDDNVTEIKYEFDNVKDTIFTEPNIDEYKK